MTNIYWDTQKPIIPETPQIYNRYTGKAKFDLFTQEEQRAIAGAAMSDVDIKLFYDRFTAADFITYEDPEMQAGLVFMEQKGLISEARHAEIIEEMTS